MEANKFYYRKWSALLLKKGRRRKTKNGTNPSNTNIIITISATECSNIDTVNILNKQNSCAHVPLNKESDFELESWKMQNLVCGMVVAQLYPQDVNTL
jgi:hypothetical protein